MSRSSRKIQNRNSAHCPRVTTRVTHTRERFSLNHRPRRRPAPRARVRGARRFSFAEAFVRRDRERSRRGAAARRELCTRARGRSSVLSPPTIPPPPAPSISSRVRLRPRSDSPKRRSRTRVATRLAGARVYVSARLLGTRATSCLLSRQSIGERVSLYVETSDANVKYVVALFSTGFDNRIKYALLHGRFKEKEKKEKREATSGEK